MTIELGEGAKLALLAQGLDQLDIGFTVFDRDLVMVAANRRFQEMLNFPDALCQPGATLQEALRHNATQGEYGPGNVDTQVNERLVLAQQFLPHRFERARPDGRIIEVCGTPLANGGMVTTYTDVTVPRQRESALKILSAELERRVEERTAELQRRELELASKAALLELVVSNVNQGITYTNADLVIELCNDKFRQLLDLPAELCKPGVAFVELAQFNALRGEYGPGDLDTLVQQRINVARLREPYFYERLRPNGGPTLEVIGTPTADGGMVTTYSDVSERKEAEIRILKLNESLEQRVAERSAELQATLENLHASQDALARSAAKAALSTLVASVTHELNTPLGNSLIAASTCGDLAQRFARQLATGALKRTELNDFVSQMEDGSRLVERNLQRAVELVRNFKQVAADQASEQRRRFELSDVVKEVMDTLSPSLNRYTHVLTVDVPKGIAMDSYPGALGQVLINLINNAYLHAFVERSGGRVELVASDQGMHVELQVTDNGAGMAQDDLAQIFQPFFSTKIGHGGTGLGTTIVENLVNETLGGNLQVTSTLGAGTRFTIRLPKQASVTPE